MLSAEQLSANIEAVIQVQGQRPGLGAIGPSLRVTAEDAHIRVELRRGDHWQSIDCSAGDPSAFAHWLNEARGGARQMIIVGVGLGDVLDVADRLGIHKVLAIEPDPGLATLLLSRRDWRPWLAGGRLRLLTGPDYRGAADIAKFFDGLSDLPVVAHPLRAELQPEAMAAAALVANRIVENARANGQARRAFAGPYLLQTLTNLPAIAREAGVEALDRAFTGVPAIVVGAGPSLDQNVADLARWQDRGVIVAADTALGPLLSGGVRPHVVVAADSSALNARHLTTVAGGDDDVMLAAEGSVHASAFEKFAARTFTFRVSNHEPWPWLHTGGITRDKLHTWGSVLTSAFDLARRMGCNPIVFAGADMAFTGGRPYCRNTIYDAMWQEWIDKGCTWEQLMADYFSRQPEVWVEDVTGASVRTAPHLVSFRNWLVEQTSQTPGTTFLNATGGGILRGGAIGQTTIEEALAAVGPASEIRATLRGRHAAFCAARRDAERLHDLLASARVSCDSVLLDRWRTFAASTVTVEEILAALPAAA